MTSLVGWVHYFNTMAKFSLRHWKPNFVLDYSSLVDVGFNTFHPAVCSNGQVLKHFYFTPMGLIC